MPSAGECPMSNTRSTPLAPPHSTEPYVLLIFTCLLPFSSPQLKQGAQRLPQHFFLPHLPSYFKKKCSKSSRKCFLPCAQAVGKRSKCFRSKRLQRSKPTENKRQTVPRSPKWFPACYAKLCSNAAGSNGHRGVLAYFAHQVLL